MKTSPLARACVTFGATGLLVIAVAGTASAHVSADAQGATRGAEGAVVTFRVPNESVNATTIGVTVTLPTDGTLLSVRSAQLAGWTSTVAKTVDGVPTAITWTAGAGASIAAGQFGQFAIDVGPLPESDSIMFAATQTFSDGSVVQWNQPPNADGSEPEHPAPELALAASTAATEHGGMVATTAPTASAPTASAAPAAATSDTTARWLGGGGLLVGALGLSLGVGATVRARKHSA